MALGLESAQHALTVALNLALALAVGSCASGLSLLRSRSCWATHQSSRLRSTGIAALLIALPASVCLLWLESAAMAEVPVLEAGSASWTMVTSTHFGLAWQIGIVALVVAVVALACRAWRVCLAGLAVFLFSRSMVCHAAANGDLALPVLVDWVHLMAICLWVGDVLVSGLLVLASAPPDANARRDCAAYVEALSASATGALVMIFGTGAFSAWHNLRSVEALLGNPYGTALLVKLSLVCAAAMLGGWNRFVVMPKLMTALAAGIDDAARRFTLILRVESAVLLAVLMAAAMLSATSPPGAG